MFYIATSMPKPELLGSLLVKALRRSKSGLNAWSRENKSGVRSSPSALTRPESRSEPTLFCQASTLTPVEVAPQRNRAAN